MRILFVSNLFPPHSIGGGYEQLCADVAERLAARGHTVHVLTSTFDLRKPKREPGIDRILTFSAPYQKPRETSSYIFDCTKNIVFTHRTIRTFMPDIIYIWSANNLRKCILNEMQRFRIPMLYHLSDPWLGENFLTSQYWATILSPKLPTWTKRMLLSTLFPPLPFQESQRSLDLRHVMCSCQHLKDHLVSHGLPLEHALVCHEGIPLEHFPASEVRRKDLSAKKTVNLLYAGQVAKHKGPHTTIEALAILVRQKGYHNVRLTILGVIRPSSYTYHRHMLSLIEKHQLEEHVQFIPPKPREELFPIFREHDIMLFPSVWEEPWSLTLLIGMACGLPVIGTTTGGSKELLKEGETGLTFPAEDAHALSSQIESLIAHQELRHRIAEKGMEKVRRNYGLDSMVDHIENYLFTMVPPALRTVNVQQKDYRNEAKEQILSPLQRENVFRRSSSKS